MAINPSPIDTSDAAVTASLATFDDALATKIANDIALVNAQTAKATSDAAFNASLGDLKEKVNALAALVNAAPAATPDVVPAEPVVEPPSDPVA